jgi:hypothetical protein
MKKTCTLIPRRHLTTRRRSAFNRFTDPKLDLGVPFEHSWGKYLWLKLACFTDGVKRSAFRGFVINK